MEREGGLNQCRSSPPFLFLAKPKFARRRVAKRSHLAPPNPRTLVFAKLTTLGLRSIGLRLRVRVDLRNLFYPPAPLWMLQIRNFLDSPMKVVGNKGYLPIQLVQGVAYDPPAASSATSNS